MNHFNKEFNVIYIRVVRGCNLNCKHCFTLGNRDSFQLAPLEKIEKYLLALKKNINPKKAVFYIHGGETFLAPLPYLKQVNALIQGVFAGTIIDIIPQTNLMYQIDDEFIAFIKAQYQGCMGVSWDYNIRFQTTSSALNEELFFRNFQKLVENKIEMAVAITVQKHLLELDPLTFLNRFTGARSIDFEFLTDLTPETHLIKADNHKWSQFFLKIVKYYSEHQTSWSLPQIDLFTQSFMQNKIYDCKCNCCQNRTFTMNTDGTVGLCPDDTYINAFSTIDEMTHDWNTFEEKALQRYIVQQAEPLPSLCLQCRYYGYCGGNCETSLFNEGDQDCPMSLLSLDYLFDHLDIFKKKLDMTCQNLVELKQRN